MRIRIVSPGWRKKYYEAAKQLEVYTYSAESNEKVRGILSGCSPKQVLKIYSKIGPCKCGTIYPKVLETECMGDYDFSITCINCGRRIKRTMYDSDVTKPKTWIKLCIRDWNNGVEQKEIEAAQNSESERRQIKEKHFKWKPIYSNNMLQNPMEGYYSLLFKKQENGRFYGCKWSIVYQHEEKNLVIYNNAKVEAYILFCKRYFDLEELFDYPSPSNAYSSGLFDGVNDYGTFERAYKTLDDAKKGAMDRCSWQGLNEDTVIN